ncbi:hypothetical protein BG015_007975 [Linnemannia schmuckeri]|uniref:Uncharacterized protein n=1 Tax=Linnemannia schmuckeri TaxID=64567 RepID=A0A9P5S5Z3_9FUNG|nr:hypothetical protein BG015_007975 [Linnemannia schmuckeri]
MSKAKLDMVPSKLAGAVRYYCYISPDHLYPHKHQDNVWNVVAQSQAEYERQTEQRRRMGLGERKSTLYNLSLLKELHLDIYTAFSNTYVHCLLPSTLTRLIFKAGFGLGPHRSSTDLGSILCNCPLLESCEVYGESCLELTWIPSKEGQQQPLALQSFFLHSTIFKQDSLENFLTFTPKLKALKLISMWSSLDYTEEYNGPRLLGHIQSLAMDLDVIHFSMQGQQSSLQVQQQLLEICPVLSEWHLWSRDVSPSFLKRLDARTNHLTTLELYCVPPSLDCPSYLNSAALSIHDVLCTSVNVVHLKTLKTVARLEDMDIHRRGGFFRLDGPEVDKITFADDTRGPSKPSTIWRCRSLQTLHIQIHGHEEFRLMDPVHSRIIFGYISRVFPLLEELQIDTPRVCRTARNIYCPRFYLELEGGFCLLGRLKYLQRLRVLISNKGLLIRSLKKGDLNWMVPIGHSTMYKWQRRLAVMRWHQRRLKEDRLEISRPHPQEETTPEDTSVSPDTEILGQLRHLGLLMDVEEMIKEMESKSYRPLPFLEGLSIKHPYFASPEGEINDSMPVKGRNVY